MTEKRLPEQQKSDIPPMALWATPGEPSGSAVEIREPNGSHCRADKAETAAEPH
jgi:hypothetical protein